MSSRTSVSRELLRFINNATTVQQSLRGISIHARGGSLALSNTGTIDFHTSSSSSTASSDNGLTQSLRSAKYEEPSDHLSSVSRPPVDEALFESVSQEYVSLRKTSPRITHQYPINSLQARLVAAVQKGNVNRATLLRQEMNAAGIPIEQHVAFEDFAFDLFENLDFLDFLSWWSLSTVVKNMNGSQGTENQRRTQRVRKIFDKFVNQNVPLWNVSELMILAARKGYCGNEFKLAFRYLARYADQRGRLIERVWKRFVGAKKQADCDQSRSNRSASLPSKNVQNDLVSIRNSIIIHFTRMQRTQVALRMVQELVNGKAFGIRISHGTNVIWPITLEYLLATLRKQGQEQLYNEVGLGRFHPASATQAESPQLEELIIGDRSGKPSKKKLQKSLNICLSEHRLSDAIDLYFYACERHGIHSAGVLAELLDYISFASEEGQLTKFCEELSRIMRSRTGKLRQVWWTAVMLTYFRQKKYHHGLQVFLQRFSDTALKSLYESKNAQASFNVNEKSQTLLDKVEPVLWCRDGVARKWSELDVPIETINPSAYTISLAYAIACVMMETVDDLEILYAHFYRRFLSNHGPNSIEEKSRPHLRIELDSGTAGRAYEQFIRRFSELKAPDRSLQVVIDMHKHHVVADERTWTTLLNCLVRSARIQSVIETIISMEKQEWTRKPVKAPNFTSSNVHMSKFQRVFNDLKLTINARTSLPQPDLKMYLNIALLAEAQNFTDLTNTLSSMVSEKFKEEEVVEALRHLQR